MENFLKVKTYGGDNFFKIIDHCITEIDKYQVICIFDFNGINIYVDSSIQTESDKDLLWTLYDYCLSFDKKIDNYEDFKKLLEYIKNNKQLIEKKIEAEQKSILLDIKKQIEEGV